MLVGFTIMSSILVGPGTLASWVPYYDLDFFRGHLLVGSHYYLDYFRGHLLVASPIMISTVLGDICLLGRIFISNFIGKHMKMSCFKFKQNAP